MKKAWSFAVGTHGHPHRVTVGENTQRGGVLALRWSVDTPNGRRPRYKSLGRSLRTSDGRIIRDVERWAKAQAQEQHDALIRGQGDDAPSLPTAPLTVAEAAARITDERRGKYPRKSQHRRETEQALAFAVTVWGAQRAWNTLRRADIRELGRARIDHLRARGHTGLAGAEHTVQRILTVAQWLRDEELIDDGACVASKEWKVELRTYWLETSNHHELPRPKQPRYAIPEAFAIIEAAQAVDPRLSLMLWLAPNQRLGQVVRVRRSNVLLEKGQLRIPTRGKKKGALIALTSREAAALREALDTGYLRGLEQLHQAGTLEDYPIFPGGPLHGGRALRRGTPSDPTKPKSWRVPEQPVARLTIAPAHRATRGAGAPQLVPITIARRTVGTWFRLAEERSGVAYVRGRGPYGIRRAFTQAGKDDKLSREGLTALGGWADPQMADRVYADQEAETASEEARDFREKLQQTHAPARTENTPNSQQTNNAAPESESGVVEGVE